jgi:hypothetical protein
MSGHIAANAGFIAALARDDEERRRAEEHAASCPACREALDEGHRLLTLVAEALPFPPPDPAALESAAAAVEKGNAAVRLPGAAFGLAAAASVVLMWAAQIAYGKRVLHDMPSVAISLLVLAVAVAGVTAGVMLTRMGRRLALGAMVLTSGLLAYVVGTVSALEVRFGIECSACELVAAAIPWFIVAMLARRRGIPIDRTSAVAVAVAGALASQAGQHVSCPVPHAGPHLMVFHLGGVLLAAGLAAVAALRSPRLAGAHT